MSLQKSLSIDYTTKTCFCQYFFSKKRGSASELILLNISIIFFVKSPKFSSTSLKLLDKDTKK